MFIIRKHFFKDISCNKWNDTYLLSNAFLFHCSVWLIYVYTMSDIAPSIQVEWNVCRLRRNHVPLKKWSNFYLSRQVKTWGLRIHKSGRMKAHHRKVKNTFSLLAKDLAQHSEFRYYVTYSKTESCLEQYNSIILWKIKDSKMSLRHGLSLSASLPTS